VVVVVGRPKRRALDVIAATIGWSILAGLSILIAAYYLGLSIDL
jgi:hypothetical protein